MVELESPDKVDGILHFDSRKLLPLAMLFVKSSIRWELRPQLDGLKGDWK